MEIGDSKNDLVKETLTKLIIKSATHSAGEDSVARPNWLSVYTKIRIPVDNLVSNSVWVSLSDSAINISWK